MLRRLLQKGLINESLYLELSDDDLPPLSRPQKRYAIDAYYVAEEVRRILFAHFATPPISAALMLYDHSIAFASGAVNALRQGLLAHESRRKYRGAEKFIDIRGLDKAAIAKNWTTSRAGEAYNRRLSSPPIKNRQRSLLKTANYTA